MHDISLMFIRLRQATFTLATTMGAYVIYALLVVPFVEPSVKLPRRGTTSARTNTRTRHWDHLFPQGSWELERPKVIETDKGTLLFDDYDAPRSDELLKRTELRLRRCSVICYVEQKRRDATSPGVERRPIVLRAMNGATLTFTGQLDVSRWQFGRLVEGRLDGEIIIYSPASDSERDDALEITTRNVQLDSEKIWTPHDVRFRYGANSGSGRDLTIHLAQTSAPSGGEGSLEVGGLRSLELLHLDHMQLEMNGSGLWGDSTSRATGQRTSRANRASTHGPTPIVVTSRGPFRFDFEQQRMTLEDQVDLVRHNSDGKSDQLACQLLEIHFSKDATPTRLDRLPEERSAKQQPMSRLEPTKVVATGNPVMIRAAKSGIETTAEWIEYDCILRRVWLRHRQRVMFKQPDREMEAQEIQYALGDSGKLGELNASGPGIARGAAGSPPKAWELRWDGPVSLTRIDGTPVLTFGSHVRVTMADTGTFQADTLHIYLKELAADDESSGMRFEPDRMHAIGNVVVDSPGLVGRVGEARLWFRPPPQSVGAGVSDTASAARDASGTKQPLVRSMRQPLKIFRSHDDQSSDEATQFDVRADIVEALVINDGQPVVDGLILRGSVEVREMTRGEPQPIAVRGDKFEFQGGATEHPLGALVGQPAELAGRGLRAQGKLFHIYPNDNEFRIVGPGEMDLAERVTADRTSPGRQPAHITWKGDMKFDGQVVAFSRGVTVQTVQPTPQGIATCEAIGELLRASLARPLEFRQTQVDSNAAELAELAFEGWAFLDIKVVDEFGERKLTQQMQVRDLVVDQRTGELGGQGPGWLRGTHRGHDLLRGDPSQPTRQSSTSKLVFLRVDFERIMAGNVHQRQLEFLQGTKTLYGPVDSWDVELDRIPDDELPSTAIVLTCQRLAVAQLDHIRGSDDIDLEATGNAFVRGKSFSATGVRVSYSKAKDQLILEGDGRNKATIAYHNSLGSPPIKATADKIQYCPSTRDCQVIGVQATEIYDVGQLRGIRAPGVQRR